MRTWLIGLLSTVMLATPVMAGDYLSARQSLIAAYQAQDFKAMRAAAVEALDYRPGYPNARYNLAMAELLNADLDAAMATLGGLVDQGIDFGVDGDAEFEALRDTAGWDSYLARLATIRQPVGQPRREASLDRPDFVPEGIAVLADGRIVLGSIRHGSRVMLTPEGAVRDLGGPETGGPWSVFGMRQAADGELWFASAAVAQLTTLPPEQRGRTGLFRLDPATGRITHRAIYPHADADQVLGDLVIDADDHLYATDSLTGALVCYAPKTGKFFDVKPAGTFNSPQGLVLDRSGKNLFVADYTGGLYLVALKSGQTTRVQAPADVSLYGVDGLYSYGNDLIAIQNGIRPHRVVRLKLSGDSLSVTGAKVLAMNLPEFDEPTLGQVHDGRFYFVANSHWNRFDKDNALPDGLTGPVVLSVALD